jgi:hypothetical protein
MISGKEPAAMDTLVNLQFLVDDAKCFDTIRRLRWPAGVRCTRCGSDNLSNQQVARELDLNVGDVQTMTEQLRAGILAARPAEILAGVVECDEIYVTAGHKGQPAAVAKKAAWGVGAA